MEVKLETNDLLDLNQTISGDLFVSQKYPWQVLPYIKKFIIEYGEKLSLDEYDKIGEYIWISKTAKVAESASLTGPLIICDNAEIRHCAFIRGSAIIGENCVVGNSTEIKNAILFNNVQVPHYNYIGDSILGYKAHLGAGAITSNVKSDKSLIVVRAGFHRFDTGLKKFGAIVGDNCEVGCNSVLNPGSVIGRSTNIYPLSMVRGYVAENCIYKFDAEVVRKCF